MSLHAILRDIQRERVDHRAKMHRLRRAFGTAACNQLRIHRMTSGDVAKALHSAVSSVSNVLHGHGWSGRVARGIADVLEPSQTPGGPDA